MKFQSLIKYIAAAVLIPTSAFVITQAATPFQPALADTTGVPNALMAQNNPNPSPRGREGRGNHGQKLLQQLNLSPDQQAQIKTIEDQARASSTGLRQQMKTAFEQMQTLLAKSDTSADQLRQAHQQIQTLRQQLSDQRFEKMLKIRAVLTPEQRTKLATLRAEASQSRRGHRRHPGMGGQGSGF
jgi:Spy/CpxP family protein refolding chaperone